MVLSYGYRGDPSAAEYQALERASRSQGCLLVGRVHHPCSHHTKQPAYAGVLRLLRGEPLGPVSRDSQIPAYELETRTRAFRET